MFVKVDVGIGAESKILDVGSGAVFGGDGIPLASASCLISWNTSTVLRALLLLIGFTVSSIEASKDSRNRCGEC